MLGITLKWDRRNKVLLVFLVLGWLSYLVWLIAHPKLSLEEVASSSFESIQSGDAQIVYDRMWPEEKTRNSVTSEGVRTVIEQIVRPALAKARTYMSLSYRQHGTYQGIRGIEYLSKSGHGYTFLVTAEARAGGGKLLLSNLIKGSWNLEFGLLDDKKWSLGVGRRCLLLGLRRDMALLDSVGFHEFCTIDGMGGMTFKDSKQLLQELSGDKGSS